MTPNKVVDAGTALTSGVMDWDPKYAVGVEQIDQQHQELFARIGRLEAAMRKGEREEVSRMLEFLGEYVVEHFGCEEREMKERAFPFFSIHKAAHDQFVQRFQEIKAEYAATGETPWLSIKVHKVVMTWLREHILGMDQRLATHLKAPVGSRKVSAAVAVAAQAVAGKAHKPR